MTFIKFGLRFAFVCKLMFSFIYVAVRVFTSIQENAPKSGILASYFVFIINSSVIVIVIVINDNEY